MKGIQKKGTGSFRNKTTDYPLNLLFTHQYNIFECVLFFARMVYTDCQQYVFDDVIHVVKNPHDQYFIVFQVFKNVGTENKDEKVHPVVIHDCRVDPEKRKLCQVGSGRSMQQMIKIYKRVSKC